MRFERITVDPLVATGKPCIRNLRFPVARLLGLLAARETRESILSAYPYMEEADIVLVDMPLTRFDPSAPASDLNADERYEAFLKRFTLMSPSRRRTWARS
jgi:uncharacterized protein (DUF433 family)